MADDFWARHLQVLPAHLQARHLRLQQEDVPCRLPMVGEGRSGAAAAAGPLGEEQVGLVRSSDCIFVASHLRAQDLGADTEVVGPDLSHRGGPPGFVKVLDPTHLQWPDYIGNYFFQTLGR